MGYHHANLCCILRVNPRCDACKKHTMEVLGSIDGVYDVTMDAESKTVRITGQVNPIWCVRALARLGVHAELVWANLSHPRASEYKSRYNYGYRRSLPEGMWHENGYDYALRNALPEYSYNYDRVPLYHQPPAQYLPYDDEDNNSMSLCSVM